MEMKKKILYFACFMIFVAIISSSCSSTKNNIQTTDEEKFAFNQTQGDTINIANEETEYEIIIIEPGFNIWLSSVAQPPGFYSQNYLENRNHIWVIEWNQRVIQPQQFDPNLYELTINYDANIDYGYDVNYQLYNYFIYFQRKYNQRLGTFFPRI
jgi:hypothetical protein